MSRNNLALELRFVETCHIEKNDILTDGGPQNYISFPWE
jgi:hypothetical protein